MIRSLLFGYGCLRKPLLCYAYLRELNGVGPDCVEDILELVDDGDEGLHAVDQLSADSANINKKDTTHAQFIQNYTAYYVCNGTTELNGHRVLNVKR